MAEDIRILTTVPGAPEKFWGRRTTLADPACVELLHGRMGSLARHAGALRVARRMLRMRSAFDVAVVDGGPVGQWFSWLQAAAPGRRLPTLMIDCLWYRHANPLIQGLKRLHKRLSARSVDRFLVWARHEVADYAREFGIPETQFAYQPFHTTLESYDFETGDQGFVFAGGNGDRDYRTLVEAVRGLDVPVFVASTNRALFRGLDIPANVTVRGVSHEEFRRRMAACTLAVLPMQGGLLHSGGQQTLLNTMFLAKPTVVVGRKVADGYVCEGRDGLVVDFGDTAALRAAVLRLWNDPEERVRMGAAAREAARSRGTTRFMREIAARAEGLVRELRGQPAPCPADLPARGED